MDADMFGALLVILYLAVGIVVARRHYRRKHGVGNGNGNSMSSFPLVFIWPAVFFSDELRNPKLCNHPNHVLRRGQIQNEIDTIDAIRRREQG